MAEISREDRMIRDLGDGLILRRASVADAEALATLNATVHARGDPPEPAQGVGLWTRDLMIRPHPTMNAELFTLVEDVRKGIVVSTLCLIPQTWTYGRIAFGVGQPELVSTHPDYRQRGLIRAQFEVVHRWSAEMGHKLQVIGGIPYFYRQFGYEMAVNLGGGRLGFKSQIPKLKEGQTEPYRVRPATEADLDLVAELYAHASRRSLLACVHDMALLRYELCGRSEGSVSCRLLRIIETEAGEPVGCLLHTKLERGSIAAHGYELKPQTSWLAVTPSVVRYLQSVAEQYVAQDPKQGFHSFAFWLGVEHPVYEVFGRSLPDVRPPYAWYVRVADLPDFLRHISPVLEERLARSPLVGHTGELKISFYRTGLRLNFEQGRLTTVEPWRPSREDGGHAAFPDRTFLQLLFGYRTLAELNYAFADCWAWSDEARALLHALFPKQPSAIWMMA